MEIMCFLGLKRQWKYVEVSENMGYPEIIHCNTIFHFKPSSHWGTLRDWAPYGPIVAVPFRGGRRGLRDVCIERISAMRRSNPSGEA